MISLDNLKTVLNAIKCFLNGYAKKKDIPTKLSNPNPLTFTGAATGSYDGSQPLTIEIPSGDGSAGNVQPDYNQNDSTAADYLKNRPFYTGDPVETVVVEESTVSFADNEGIYAAELPAAFVATVGETYTVYWDGTAYECICVDLDGIHSLGNLSIPGIGSDTGEPFVLGFMDKGIAIYTKDTSASHTISISGLVTEIVKIDAKYLPFPFKPSGESYLTFSSRNSFSLAVEGKTWNGTLEYFASDKTWTVWDGMSPISAEPNGGGYVIYLRGTGNTVITDHSAWAVDASDIACIGNIENLLDYTTVETGQHPVMAENCFYGMFEGCTGLTQAPELPATTLAFQCYFDMFRDCTSLTKAPALPATTLVTSCYCAMFSGCTSLKEVPELPATTLTDSCYNAMFYGCTSLTKTPELPANTLATNCYCVMFSGCTSLIQIPELPATTLANDCYDRMFEGCTSLKLSTIKTEEYTQEYRIPISGDGTTAAYALNAMFDSTGGTFTGTPSINTTYYLSSENMIARGTKLATLNGYVQSMIDNAGCIIPSSTTGSTKKFKITVDDSGTITATEVI